MVNITTFLFLFGTSDAVSASSAILNASSKLAGWEVITSFLAYGRLNNESV